MSSHGGGEVLFSSQWGAFGGLSVGRVAAGRSMGGPGWSWWPMTDGQVNDFRMLLEVGLTGRGCEGRMEDGSWLLKDLSYWEDGGWL